MTDEDIDELLADLDRALAVEPSPSVAARVRTSLARDPVASWFGLHWHVLAAGAAALIVVGTVAWPRVDEVSVRSRTVATQPTVSSVAAPAATPTPRPFISPQSDPLSGGRKGAASLAPGRSANREPEVLVSPSQRLALEQLATVIREGRINSDSFPAEPAPAPLELIVITPFRPEVVTIQPFSGSAGGGGPVR